MKKIREIIRLLHETQLSQRQISNALNVSRPVVAKVIDTIEITGLNYIQVEKMPDTELAAYFSENKKLSTKYDKLKELFPYFTTELTKIGVTIKLLWEEYIHQYPGGFRYSQFCYHYQKWREDTKITMHIEHKAGDKMFVDYTGKKMALTDRKSGATREVETFVAILPASQLTYAEATERQDQESFVRSNERAIRYMNGVPAAIVPDNLKAGVLKASIYEPDLNPLFADFAEYYRTAILPARKRKPKDKAHVENAVKLIYQRVFAPLRNRVFYTLDELNEAIKERLEVHNNQKLTHMTVSRHELFEKVEKKVLKALPVHPYPIRHIQANALVNFNYHVELKEDRHYYSVPYALNGQRVKLIYDEKNVSIYHNNIRIVMHRRDRRKKQYTTVNSHMPAKHRFKEKWNPGKLKWWASKIGPDTLRAITYILESKPHPEQAYKSCMGILSLAGKHGNSTLNTACRIACNFDHINYGFISKEVKRLIQQNKQKMDIEQLRLFPVHHENVRGEKYYQ